MPRATTFGCEAEFEANAAGVIARLHEIGLSAEPNLHSYHCDCEACQFGNAWPFRGQTDSSCSGEIITDIFGSTADAYGENGMDYGYDHVAMFAALSAAAVEVDAEPGLRSAFHVHVGIQDLNYEDRVATFWQFLRWEPVLMKIAGGRWPHQRSGMNNTAAECVSESFEDMTGRNYNAKSLRDFTPDYDVLSALLQCQSDSDRHSNLNVSNRRAPTWEFRLWNSTRTAWRMEMFAGLSVALTDPTVVQNLSELATPRSNKACAGISDIIDAVGAAGHDRTADLIIKQDNYLKKRAESAPSVLTVL